MVKEDLGDLSIGVLVGDHHVVGGQVAADRLEPAGLASLDRLVERALDHRCRRQFAEVAGKQRGHELPLAEDPGEVAVLLDRRQPRKPGVHDLPGRVSDQLVGAERLDFA